MERLTAHEHTDTSFTKTFLMTFKSFTDVDALVDLLIARCAFVSTVLDSNADKCDDWVGSGSRRRTA